MAMSAEYRSKFVAFHQEWWRLHEWKILERETKKLKKMDILVEQSMKLLLMLKEVI